MPKRVVVRNGVQGRKYPRPVTSLAGHRIQVLRSTDRRQFTGVAEIRDNEVHLYTGHAGKPPVIPVEALSDVVVLSA